MGVGHRVVVATVAISAGLALPRPAEGCSCMPTPPLCQAYWTSDTVFAGRVVSVAEGADGERSGSVLVRMEVERVYRGLEAEEVQVGTMKWTASCGYPFRRGERYLVYAQRHADTGRLTTNLCSLTKRLAEAAPDLEFIEGLSEAPPGARIFGRIVRSRTGDVGAPRPIRGMTVQLIHDSGTVTEVVSDREGRFEAIGLQPGEYTVVPVVNGESQTRFPGQTSVVDRGCAALDVYVDR